MVSVPRKVLFDGLVSGVSTCPNARYGRVCGQGKHRSCIWSMQERCGIFSFDFPQLFGTDQMHSFIPSRRFIVRLTSTHPTATMNLSFWQPSNASASPCFEMILAAHSAQNAHFSTDSAYAPPSIITAISVQWISLLDISSSPQESSGKFALLQAAYLPRKSNFFFHIIIAPSSKQGFLLIVLS